MKTLGEIFTRNAKLYPNKNLIYKDRKVSFRELNLRVNRLVSAMAARGVTKGDRVAILSKNCPEYIEAYGLAEKGGIILVPLNWRLVARELKFMLADTGAKAVIVSPEYIDTINSIRDELPDLKIYFSLESSVSGYEFYENILAQGSPDEPMVEIDEDDVVYIMYSSGTTGLPKGIMLTHRGQLDDAVYHLVEFGTKENHVFLQVMPLFHIGGKATFLALFHRGCSIAIMPEFDTQEVLEIIQREKVNVTCLVPSMIALLLDYPDFKKYDISSLETVFLVASPISLSLLKRAVLEFGPVFCQGYGLTESGGLVAFLSKENLATEGELVRRLSSCGRPSMACEIRIIKDDGQEAGPGEIGEITTMNQRLMRGYLNQPEKTAAVLRDGWLFTGDMARVDEDGYIYIVDRKNDMIISGGENIYPREIEEVFHTHPAVLEAAVIGIPDEKWGESVKAFVCLKQGATADEAEIIEFCKEKLASYKKPKSVEFLKELPRNASGKVLKTVLRQKYWSGQERRV